MKTFQRRDNEEDMLIDTLYNGVELVRKDKIIYGKFITPHLVISTCQVAGGIKKELEYLYNHQSCEPTKHSTVALKIIKQNKAEYRKHICEKHDLDAEKCATLGTAANMRHAAVKKEEFRDLVVVAVCTGGVEGNAGRAGDPAAYYENDGIFEKVSNSNPEPAGTINTLLFINKELTPGTLSRTIMTATEAKTAVLQELGVTSKYSDGHATGTGTDQIGVACQLNTGKPLTSAGKHSKLGELIGKTVHSAIKETLAQQNGLYPQSQRSLEAHLKRFGGTKDAINTLVTSHLNGEDATIWMNNFMGIHHDSLVVGSVAALVHLRDKISWGVIPKNCLAEFLSSFGAQISSAVSGKYEKLWNYRKIHEELPNSIENSVFLESICKVLALGFSDKWNDTLKESN